MAEEKNRPSQRRSASKRKPKKNQIPLGIGAVVIAIVIAILLGQHSTMVSFFWITGIAFGVILQRGRFCFTASMRDPYLTGGTTLTRAVIIAIGLTTIGFTAIKYGYHAAGLPIPGMGYVAPISIATVIGAFLFGIGMVIAGGCASGTLMRVGEGFLLNIITFVFFMIGSLWGARDFGWWSDKFISTAPRVFLPDVLGWMGAVVLQLGILTLLYVFAQEYEKRNV